MGGLFLSEDKVALLSITILTKNDKNLERLWVYELL